MPNEDLVQPKNPTETKAAELPDEILHIPAMQALFAGNPPAVSASIAQFSNRPEGKLIQQHHAALSKAGMGLYRALDGDTGIMFNQFYLNGEELKQADKAGQLQSIAPPFDTVNQSIAQSGANNPVLKAGQVPNGFKTNNVPKVATPTNNVMPAPASGNAQQKLMSARVTNLKPSSPTSGPKPGSGRILNAILKPVI